MISIQPLTWLPRTLHARWGHNVALERSSSGFLKTSQASMSPISRCTMRSKKIQITRRRKSMNQRNAKANSNNAMHGLSLSGTVIDRTRRMVPHDNPTTEIVTCTIQDGYNRKFYVDDYAPAGYYDFNSSVCFPVYIKAYNRKNGEPSYTLNMQKMEVTRDEHF